MTKSRYGTESMVERSRGVWRPARIHKGHRQATSRNVQVLERRRSSSSWGGGSDTGRSSRTTLARLRANCTNGRHDGCDRKRIAGIGRAALAESEAGDEPSGMLKTDFECSGSMNSTRAAIWRLPRSQRYLASSTYAGGCDAKFHMTLRNGPEILTASELREAQNSPRRRNGLHPEIAVEDTRSCSTVRERDDHRVLAGRGRNLGTFLRADLRG